ncbi:MAG: site-specific DNA-methyltransferase [Bacteroidetes bacterium]|nr:site-specific DNA-methyltransferase [Bacteroidota bacterium]
MEKLKMESADLTEQNIDKIAALFPNVISETKDADGNLKKAINFTLLQQILQGDLVDGDECYEFTWAGKKQSIIDGNSPLRKTLRPCPEESKDWDKTENLYIEGDNLEVLKLLQGSYLNSIKMMYFDPPYNTGNDFVYRDNFTAAKDEYEEDVGLFDENENRLFKNTESNGRFHSDWCSMMYPRLQLARNLLTDDGVIVISIDDGEVNNLIKICVEIFGEENHLATFLWKSRQTTDSRKSTNMSIDHEYIVAFTNRQSVFSLKGNDIDKGKYTNPDNDPRGSWASIDLSVQATRDQRPNQFYEIINPITGISYPANSQRVWSKSKDVVNGMIKENRIIFPDNPSGRPREKKFLSDLRSEITGFSSWLDPKDVGYTTNGTRELSSLFEQRIFDFPKSTKLLCHIINQASTEDSIILDIFSGSATTAHAVMKLNAKDGGSRKFIMVQLPETTDEKSEAYKAGYKNICEIGKERIRKAGEKVKEEAGLNGQNLDIGFRVLKLDSTNMKDVYYGAGEYSQQMLLDLESNIKNDRTDLDLLYGVLLNWGVPLALPHTNEMIGGVKVHFVNGVDLVACFADNVNETIIREIAKRKPLRVVFRDSSFANSPDKINVTEIFKTISPETTVKVI